MWLVGCLGRCGCAKIAVHIRKLAASIGIIKNYLLSKCHSTKAAAAATTATKTVVNTRTDREQCRITKNVGKKEREKRIKSNYRQAMWLKAIAKAFPLARGQ